MAGPSQRPGEAEGSLIRGTPGRAGSSPDNAGTGQHRQMVRVRLARREGVTRVNQCLKVSQGTHQLEPDGSGLGRNAQPHDWCGELLGRFRFSGREAMVNACGVAVAMLLGHSWAPTPLNASRVNVGTISTVPPCRPARTAGGKARCRLMLAGWGGGPVVVRDRESRSHGEGVQLVRSIRTERGGRW